MSEASLNAKLHKGAHSRLKAEIDSLKKWREDHYPKVSSLSLVGIVLPSAAGDQFTMVYGPYNMVLSRTSTPYYMNRIYFPQKMFGGLKDVERYEKQFKEATLPYRNAVNNVNEAKAKYHQDTD